MGSVSLKDAKGVHLFSNRGYVRAHAPAVWVMHPESTTLEGSTRICPFLQLVDPFRVASYFWGLVLRGCSQASTHGYRKLDAFSVPRLMILPLSEGESEGECLPRLLFTPPLRFAPPLCPPSGRALPSPNLGTN